MIPSVLSKHTDSYDDEDESRSFNALWWDTKQKLAEIPRLATALFVKPNHEGIQCTADLVYEYGQAVKHIPSLLRRLSFKTRTLEDELQEVRSCFLSVLTSHISFQLLIHYTIN